MQLLNDCISYLNYVGLSTNKQILYQYTVSEVQ